MKTGRLGLAAMAAALLFGGCSDGSSPAAVSEPPSASADKTAVEVIVISEGAIENAVVCSDTNENGACDTSGDEEPRALTNVAGKATLNLPNDHVGKHTIIAEVGTDAVENQNGAAAGNVQTAYRISAPADRPAVVSPLTTLVQAYSKATGASTTDAEIAIKDALGQNLTLFSDYSIGTDASSTLAGDLARLIVAINQVLNKELNPENGADKTAVIHRSFLSILSSLAAAVADPAILAETDPAARKAAIQLAAVKVALESGLTIANIQEIVAIYKQPPALDVPVTVVEHTLRWFEYFSPLGEYFVRSYTQTAEQATPDPNGVTHYTEFRKRVNQDSPVPKVWGDEIKRNQVLWTGTEWFACPENFVHERFPSTESVFKTIYCKSVISVNKRSERDIAGKSIAEIVSGIRAYTQTDNEGDFSIWGRNPAELLGSFPVGSKLFYQNVSEANPDRYDTVSPLRSYPAGFSSATDLQCSYFRNNNILAAQHEAASFSELLELTAKPCNMELGLFPKFYELSVLSLIDVPGKEGFERIAVSFGEDGKTQYWRCGVFGFSTGNCSPTGTGTYAIQTVGDARVMRFTNLPVQAADRIFVERGRLIYPGLQKNTTFISQILMNGTAANAMLGASGLPNWRDPAQ